VGMSERRGRYITMNVKKEDWERLKEIAEEYQTTMVGAVRLLLKNWDIRNQINESMNRIDTKLEFILKTLVRIEERLEKLEQELRERGER